MSRFAAFLLVVMIAVVFSASISLDAKPTKAPKPPKPAKAITHDPEIDEAIDRYRSALKEDPPPPLLSQIATFKRKGFHIEAASMQRKKERFQLVVISREPRLPANVSCVLLTPTSRANFLDPSDLSSAGLTDIAITFAGSFELIPFQRLNAKTPDHVTVFEGVIEEMRNAPDIAGANIYYAIQICTPPVQKAASNIRCVRWTPSHLVNLPNGVALVDQEPLRKKESYRNRDFALDHLAIQLGSRQTAKSRLSPTNESSPTSHSLPALRIATLLRLTPADDD